jgi:predicted metal-dependent peptidase
MAFDIDGSVSQTVARLLFEKTLYAHVCIRCRKIYVRGEKTRVKTAAVSITDQVNLIINADWWEKLNNEQRKGVIEHEILHLVYYHLQRMRNFSNRDKYNIATDLVVWQYVSKDRIPEIDHMCVLSNPKIRDKQGNQLPENKDADWYYYNMHQDTCSGGGIVLVDSHDGWGTTDNIPEDIKDAILKEVLRQAFEACNKSYGNVPAEAIRSLENIFAPKVKKLPYNQVIRKFISRSITGDIKYSKRRESKRYHTHPGIKIGNKLKLLIGFDTSGSVDDYMLRDFINQVQFLSKMGIEIWITECDTKTYRLYKFRRDIKVVMGGGGTDMEPIIETGENGTFDGVIVFTDGEIPPIVRNAPKFPVLWVIASRTPDAGIPVKWGEKINMPILERYGD